MFNSQCSILIRKEKRPRVRAVLIEADGILSCIGGTFGNPTSTSDEN